jgi:hypothetical protein
MGKPERTTHDRLQGEAFAARSLRPGSAPRVEAITRTSRWPLNDNPAIVVGAAHESNA